MSLTLLDPVTLPGRTSPRLEALLAELESRRSNPCFCDGSKRSYAEILSEIDAEYGRLDRNDYTEGAVR